jgi:hypothetical protein
MACTRKKTLDHVSVRKLDFNSNSANMKTLMNNSGINIDMKLLAIEENIEPDHVFPCIYDEQKTDFSICNIIHENFVHFYISTNILKRHYMIVLLKKVTLNTQNIKTIVDKLYNSVMRFKIEDSAFPNIASFKPLRYCIYFYGDSSCLNTSNLDSLDLRILDQLAHRLHCDKSNIKIKTEIIGNTNYLTIRTENEALRFNFTAADDVKAS